MADEESENKPNVELEKGKQLQQKIEKYFVRLRREGKLEEAYLEWWLAQLRSKVLKVFGPNTEKQGYDVLQEGEPPEEKLQREVTDYFRYRVKNENLERRHVERWLDQFKAALLGQLGYVDNPVPGEY